MKHVVFFSSGAGSWAAAKRVAEKHGTENLVLLFADTGIEDEDNYRYLEDAAKNVGGELVVVKDGRTPWDVFKDNRWIGNSRIAQCSHVLKQATCKKWLKEFDPEKTATLYVGIDWTEIHRVDAIVRGWAPWKVEAPLCLPPYLNKRDIIAWGESEGLVPPRLYSLGFSHANCFHPDTRYICKLDDEELSTVKSLAETLGQTVEVIGYDGKWKKAEIKSFGEQPLWRLALTRRKDVVEIFCTEDHLWPIFNENYGPNELRKTSQLSPGTIIQSKYIGDGFIHGGRIDPRFFTHWEVGSVAPAGFSSEVMCAVVPDGNMFTLEGNIHTHNCGGFCVRGGQGHFATLLRAFPERYRHH